MSNQHSGGRKKLDLSESEWKARKKAQREERNLREKKRRWEQVVNGIIVRYIEGQSILDIVEDCMNEDYELRLKSAKS